MTTIENQNGGIRPNAGLEPSRGSALIMTVFVLALLTTMALILVYVSRTEVKMSEADAEAKQAFFLAEAATEHGRELLRQALVAAQSSALTPSLGVAAGTNASIDLTPANVRPRFTNGQLSGFSGTGDDVPLIAPTAMGEGWYAAFVTNDPADGETSTTDTNDFVMITGLGVGPNGSFEMAQAIVQPGTIFPAIPAAITLLGPTPEFDLGSGKGWAGIECPGGSSTGIKGSKVWVDGALVKRSKLYKAFNGTDCSPYRELGLPVTVGSKTYNALVDAGGGGIPGTFMPVIGVVGPTAESDVESEVKGSKIDYISDEYVRTSIIRPTEPTTTIIDDATVADLTDPTEPTVIGSGLGTLNSTWTNCNAVKNLIETLRSHADYECTAPACTLPALTPSTLSFINGDHRLDCDSEGFGMLVVTGALDMPASASWKGIIFVIGEGEFYRVKGKDDGYGNVSGATVVADIAGPDNVYGTMDDCTGGVAGFDSVYFEEQKKRGRGTTVYCSDDIAAADPGFREPAATRSFRQN